MEKIKYIGCFYDQELILQKAKIHSNERLYRSIKHPHTTFFYRPETVPYDMFGSIVTVRVTGYARDSENEAFLVEFENLPKGLEELASQIKTPHITISVSKTGEPVNSGNLKFTPIAPFLLSGIFGGMDENGTVHIG